MERLNSELGGMHGTIEAHPSFTMFITMIENPADLLYKVANYAKDTDAQATASSGNIYIGKDGMFKIFNEYGGNPKKYHSLDILVIRMELN